MSVQVSYKKQSVFAIFLILIIILVLEIISNIVLEINDSCTQSLSQSEIYENFSHEKLKNICKDYQSTIHFVTPYNHLAIKQYSDTVNINSEGFRGSEMSDELNSKYTIFLTGGSTAFGIYASGDDKTISSQLEKIFQKNGYDVNVVNAGVNGAFSSDEYFLIKTKILKYSPNLILTFTGWNDLETNFAQKSGVHTTETTISNNLLYLQKFTKIDDLQFYLSRIIEKRLPVESESIINFSSINQRSENWKNNLNKICDLGNDKKFKTIIAFQPLLGSGNKILSNWENTIYKNYNQKKVLDEYEIFKTNINSIESCTEIIDLTTVFDNTEKTIFHDTGHFGDLGNQIVAQQIYKEISSIVIEDISNFEN
tara:strand:- start:417 stop:1520 length:1104 start_codon:yes stop_codon:yes gene_type:complete